MTATQQTRLVLPAIRAQMGDWIYYVSTVKMKDIAERVRLAAEIYGEPESLDELIQRALTDRAVEIKTYLLTQEQRFFNSLVVAVCDGLPQWYELTIRNNEYSSLPELPDDLEGALGILVFEGSEKLYALDGQHRVVGIKQAISENDALASEEVSTIFLSHKSDAAGFIRTRRLFATLNRYAKPVTKKEVISLDEDDIVAITTRKLVREHPLFRNKTNMSLQKSLSPTEDKSFTTIVALYDACEILIRDPSPRKWSAYKRFRRPDAEIDQCHRQCEAVWELLAKDIGALQEFQQADPGPGIASKFRSKMGGHVAFRPIGLLLLVRVIRHLMDSGDSLKETIEKVSRLPLTLGDVPWAGVIWDPQNQRMITAPENQKMAERIAFTLAGGDLKRLQYTKDRLISELSGLLQGGVTLDQFAEVLKSVPE